jgi:tetratricopeptide (TPR) repeat protein
MNSTKLSALCDKILEICWLLAVIVTPLFFNVNSNNVFERDKWTTLRTIVLVMVVVWLVRIVEEWISNGKPDLRVTWRTPLVLPILVTIGVYLVSTVFSITPYVSIFGGYQRLRGTFSTLSCVVIALIVLDRLQTREQVDRFITVMILNSLPIALYGFIQHNGLDPLPWGGDVTGRIASNMGNPIFVAAYMIMAAIPTLARLVAGFQAILTDEETGTADVLRSAAYIFLFLVQVISILYSQSRGPLMGLVAGLGVWLFLGLLSFLRSAQRERPFRPAELWGNLGRGLSFGLASVAAAGVGLGLFYFIGKGINGLWLGQLADDLPMWAGAVGGGLAFLATWMGFIISRRGWRWLWAGALLLALLFAVFFLLINLVDPIHDWSKQLPWLGRLGDVLHESGGTTGKVRAYIWEGALEMVLPHEPIELPPTEANPNWHPDPVGAVPVIGPYLRTLIGHGPESMYVAYNRFYPPELGHVESRTATPDRSHNETLDMLVINGLLGLVAYLWVFGAIFYFGLRWMGFVPDGWRRTLFFALLGGMAVVAVVVSGVLLGPHFFGLAIPVGMVGGLFVYLVVYGFSLFWEREAIPAAHPHFGLLSGILAAVVAHFIEVNFGIAIASTRTILWTLVGMLVVLGMKQVRDQTLESQTAENGREKQGKRRKKRRKRRRVARRSLPDWVGPTLAVGAVGGFILGTLAFDFVSTNPNPEPYNINVWAIVWRALTIRPYNDQAVSYGVFMIFAFTWLMSGVVFIAHMVKRDAFRKREQEWAWAAGTYLIISLVIGIGFAVVMANRQVRLVYYQSQLHARAQDETAPLTPQEYLAGIVGFANMIAGHMATYYAFIVFVLIVGGVGLYLGMRRQPQQTAHLWGVVTLCVLVLVMGYVAVTANLRPIQADMVYKVALSYEKEGLTEALKLYERAIELAPHEDFYYFEMGRVYLMNTLSQETGPNEEYALAAIDAFKNAQAIAPLNTDHAKGLAKSYHVWAKIAAAAGDNKAYQERIDRAVYYYEIATSLSPHNAFLRNEWVKFYLEEGQFERAGEVVADSLEIDPEYDETWLLAGEVQRLQGNLAEAAEAYERAVEIRPRQANVWRLLGDIYLQLDRPSDAARALVGLGDMHVDQEAFTDAIEAYNQARSLDADLPEAWSGLGAAYVGMNQLPEAVEAYEQALALGVADAWEVHRALASAYHQMGQTGPAISHAREALELAPEDAQADLQTWLDDLQASSGDARP